MRLRDKAIIVTGSTTGIGKAIARACLDEGARVLIHGLEEDLARQARNELDPDHGRTAVLVEDLCADGAPARIVAAALDAFGRIDGLVNNAALVIPGNLESTGEAIFDRVLATNLRAPFFLIRAALPALSASRGSVLNIGSVNAWAGEPDLLPYSISKGALMTLSRNLGDALHREHGVRVNQINPGWILTENERQRKREHGLPDDWPKLLGKTYAPSGRIFAPSEVAAAAVFFLSDDCGPVSGTVMELEQYPILGRNPPKEWATPDVIRSRSDAE